MCNSGEGMEETKILDTFLYGAIFIPEGVEVPPKDIIQQPELQLCIEDFGNRRWKNKAATLFLFRFPKEED